jgi:hypothetical protein
MRLKRMQNQEWLMGIVPIVASIAPADDGWALT